MGFGIQVLGSGIWDLGVEVWGLGCRVQGSELPRLPWRAKHLRPTCIASRVQSTVLCAKFNRQRKTHKIQQIQTVIHVCTCL